MKKASLALAALIILCAQGKAQIGWTLKECEQHYGKPVSEPTINIDPGVTQHHFKSGKLDLYIRISASSHLVTAMYYSKLDRGPFSAPEITRLLSENGADLAWSEQQEEQTASSGQKSWVGRKNGKTILSASYRLMEEGEGYVLNIWVGR
jgi:hypothetical protein